MNDKAASLPAALAQRSLKSRATRTAAVLAMLLAVLGTLVIIANPFEKKPNLFLVRELRTGMTESDVGTIFGTSPTTVTPWQLERMHWSMDEKCIAKYWHCDAGIVRVVFGNDGRVVLFTQHGYREVENPIVRKTREALRRIGLF